MLCVEDILTNIANIVESPRLTLKRRESKTSRRIARERKTIEKMMFIHCKDKHGASDKLCDNCQETFEYAMKRLDRCKFGESKPVCAKCSIHCYQSEMRKRIIDVMRYAGPKMLFRHPILALLHLTDSFKS